MSYLTGKFVWFEYATNDIAKARAFYEPLFGWHTESMSMGNQTYQMIQNAGQGIGGYVPAKPGAGAAWISYMSVTDVDGRYAAALAAGAKPLEPPTDFPPVGRGAALIDPTGAAVSLWKSSDGDRPDAEKPPFNEWCWNELWTQDDKKALAFYEQVFGYTHDTMEGPNGPYHILKGPDGQGRAGLMKMPDPQAPTLWCPYASVADCDAAVDKARGLGAQVMMPGTDIPNIGRFAVLVDPQGACIAMIQPAPMGA